MRGRSRRSVILALGLLGGALGLGSLGLGHASGRDAPSARVLLRDQAGQPVGVVKLTQERKGKVLVRAVVHDLPAGFHGFHVHAVGNCVPPFTSAGGHYNPRARVTGTTPGTCLCFW